MVGKHYLFIITTTRRTPNLFPRPLLEREEDVPVPQLALRGRGATTMGRAGLEPATRRTANGRAVTSFATSTLRCLFRGFPSACVPKRFPRYRAIGSTYPVYSILIAGGNISIFNSPHGVGRPKIKAVKTKISRIISKHPQPPPLLVSFDSIKLRCRFKDYD